MNYGTYHQIFDVKRQWGTLEQKSLTVFPVTPRLRIRFQGIQDPSFDQPTKSYGPDCGYPGIPAEEDGDLLIPINAPCARCRSFVQKVVLLSQEVNTNILGILRRIPGGYSILPLESYKAQQVLGLPNQLYLLSHSEHVDIELPKVDDSIHDTLPELHAPCPLSDSCLKLSDSVSQWCQRPDVLSSLKYQAEAELREALREKERLDSL